MDVCVVGFKGKSRVIPRRLVPRNTQPPTRLTAAKLKVSIKLINHHAMKTYGGVQIYNSTHS
jgi:hypothetical protein